MRMNMGEVFDKRWGFSSACMNLISDIFQYIKNGIRNLKCMTGDFSTVLFPYHTKCIVYTDINRNKPIWSSREMGLTTERPTYLSTCSWESQQKKKRSNMDNDIP